MREPSALEKRCRFDTARLAVQSWNQFQTESSEQYKFAEKVQEILSDKVTKSLPDGWQHIDSIEKAIVWIEKRLMESSCFVVREKSTKEIIGFIFLYELGAKSPTVDLRLGFLLAESAWGKGYGSELIAGLVAWGKKDATIKSLSGGVEQDNFGSIKVLEKNGFKPMQAESPGDTALFFELRFDSAGE